MCGECEEEIECRRIFEREEIWGMGLVLKVNISGYKIGLFNNLLRDLKISIGITEKAMIISGQTV